MKRITSYAAILVVMFFGTRIVEGANISILHSFKGTDGASPFGGVIFDGSTMYGTTTIGGSSHASGTVYSMNSDGTGYHVLHNFDWSGGFYPLGELVLSGATLYGVTEGGAEPAWSTVYQLNTNGTNYKYLHTFMGKPYDGTNPAAGLCLDGSWLYGTTSIGGANDVGTAFKVRVDGTGYKVLHSFGNGNDGACPSGSLTVSGSYLYGMTEDAIYRMNLDGTGFTVLRSGEFGDGGLTLDGSIMYGVSSNGNPFGSGVIFSMNIDGTNFKSLHSMEGSSFGKLALVGSTLYGSDGSAYGAPNTGNIFSINTDGTDYTILHIFTGGINDGLNPSNSVTIIGSTLYGTTSQGGEYNLGTVYSMPIPEPSTLAMLLPLALGGLLWWRRCA